MVDGLNETKVIRHTNPAIIEIVDVFATYPLATYTSFLDISMSNNGLCFK